MMMGVMLGALFGYLGGQEDEKSKLRNKAWLILYDDQDVKPEIFSGEGAEAAAKYRFRQLSTNWNAHLFVLYESNSRDVTLGNVL